MQALSQWVLGLGSYNLPVLAHTVQALAELRKREDSVTARDIAEVVLSDPLMSVKVLRFSQARLTSRQPTEVTTVEHAVMMHGVASFFRQFRDLTSLEISLEGNPDALRGALTVVSRAYHASINARNFAALRHDMEGDEVMISALLHDLAEMLLWCVAPSAAMQIDQMLVCNKGLRSASAQKATMGFPLADLQLALAREWRLPNLLQRLMDDRHAANARVVTVRMSVALARHAAHGWYDPALPDDYAGLQKLLSLPVDQVKRWVRQSALQAGRAWKQFAVRPAATWLPMLPGDWPVPEVRPAALSGGAQEALVARCREQLGAATKDNNGPLSVLALAFYGLQAGLGLRRLWFGVVNPTSGKVEPRQTLLLDPGIAPEDLAFAVDSQHLFARLMQRSQGVWYSVGNREKLKPLVPEALRPKIGVQDFFAMSIHLKGALHGLVYADGGTGTLDETRYTAFKQICAAASEALQRVGS